MGCALAGVALFAQRQHHALGVGRPHVENPQGQREGLAGRQRFRLGGIGLDDHQRLRRRRRSLALPHLDGDVLCALDVLARGVVVVQGDGMQVGAGLGRPVDGQRDRHGDRLLPADVPHGCHVARAEHGKAAGRAVRQRHVARRPGARVVQGQRQGERAAGHRLRLGGERLDDDLRLAGLRLDRGCRRQHLDPHRLVAGVRHTLSHPCS